MIFIRSSGEFSCIYFFLVFSVCLILFHFILFLANFTPFGRVVFFFHVWCLPYLLQENTFQWVRDSEGRLIKANFPT